MAREGASVAVFGGRVARRASVKVIRGEQQVPRRAFSPTRNDIHYLTCLISHHYYSTASPTTPANRESLVIPNGFSREEPVVLWSGKGASQFGLSHREQASVALLR